MSEPIRFEEDVVRAICQILGDTSAGLTGREIGELLRSCRIDDPMPSASKRDRLFEALSQRQRADGAGNAVAMFILRAMSLVAQRQLALLDSPAGVEYCCRTRSLRCDTLCPC